MSTDSAWVDGPLPLIAIPEVPATKAHAALKTAREMAHVHNTMIRGFNAIYLQAPHVKSSGESGYIKADVADLLYYISAWVRNVAHHHDGEEEVFFPALAALMSGDTASSTFLTTAKEQHAALHSGLDELLAYTTISPQDYQWTALKPILDALSEPFLTHFKDEVTMLKSLTTLDSKGMAAAYQKTEDHAKASAGLAELTDIFPIMLGCCDRGQWFVPAPTFVIYIINYITWHKHKGAWRFNPCDGFGRPRALQMVPK